MHPFFQRFFSPKIDAPRIVAAIASAEARTSGELRVVLVRHHVADPIAEAQLEFQKLGMDKTRHRNGVLILFASRSRKFAIIGDSGVHALCGDSFWEELAATMSTCFRRRQFTEGLEQGIARAGNLLARHFPAEPDDIDELPNDIVERP